MILDPREDAGAEKSEISGVQQKDLGGANGALQGLPGGSEGAGGNKVESKVSVERMQPLRI